jgi:transcriptional antiterminator RfaH
MWYAIYTKQGKEDSIAIRLQGIGIDVLNPKLKSRKFIQNRLGEVIEPLFPCYLFAEFEKEKYAHMITYTRGVRYIVGKQNPIVVHEEVISTIRKNITHDNIVMIKPQMFSQGDAVTIKDGPFKHFSGIFESEIRGPERVMILLDTLSCRLEIDSCCLTKARALFLTEPASFPVNS